MYKFFILLGKTKIELKNFRFNLEQKRYKQKRDGLTYKNINRF